MSRPNGRANRSTGGVKALLTTMAVVGTVGGWAHLTASEPSEEPAEDPTPTTLALEFAPLPTLVPEPTAFDAPPATAAPTPTAMVLRRVDNPASAPSSGGGGRGGGRSRSS